MNYEQLTKDLLTTVLASLPERDQTTNTPWAIPISGERIPTEV